MFYRGGYILPHTWQAWVVIAERIAELTAHLRGLAPQMPGLAPVVAALERVTARLEDAMPRLRTRPR